MTEDEIKRLLEGFYDGSLSEQDEERLKEAMTAPLNLPQGGPDTDNVGTHPDASYGRINREGGSKTQLRLLSPDKRGSQEGVDQGVSLHETDKHFFRSLFANETTKADVPDGLEERLSRMIDERAAAERGFFPAGRVRRNWRWIGGIAATVLLLVGIGFGTLFPKTDTQKDTFTDPQEAYRVLQATLMEVSACMNEGLAQVQEVQTDFEEISQELKNELQN